MLQTQCVKVDLDQVRSLGTTTVSFVVSMKSEMNDSTWTDFEAFASMTLQQKDPSSPLRISTKSGFARLKSTGLVPAFLNSSRNASFGGQKCKPATKKWGLSSMSTISRMSCPSSGPENTVKSKPSLSNHWNNVDSQRFPRSNWAFESSDGCRLSV